MASKTSLRNFLTYASNLFSQVPLRLSDIPNQFGAVLSPPSTTSSDSSDYSPAGHVPDTITPYIPLTGAPSCPLDGPVSCHNKTAGDSCCFVYPGGRLLLTQFWDEQVHVGGSEEDWTVHGLW
jgi:ribonuclease T2